MRSDRLTPSLTRSFGRLVCVGRRLHGRGRALRTNARIYHLMLLGTSLGPDRTALTLHVES